MRRTELKGLKGHKASYKKPYKFLNQIKELNSKLADKI